MITLGADVHAIEKYPRTPFHHFLVGFTKHWDTRPPSELPVDSGLDLWLNSLENCGVDLSEYGKREGELHEQSLVWNGFRVIEHAGSLAGAKIASFTYGSSPDEWDIKVEWEILGPNHDSDQVKEIPGSWIED